MVENYCSHFGISCWFNFFCLVNNYKSLILIFLRFQMTTNSNSRTKCNFKISFTFKLTTEYNNAFLLMLNVYL
jgi:hypothetical protein